MVAPACIPPIPPPPLDDLSRPQVPPRSSYQVAPPNGLPASQRPADFGNDSSDAEFTSQFLMRTPSGSIFLPPGEQLENCNDCTVIQTKSEILSCHFSADGQQILDLDFLKKYFAHVSQLLDELNSALLIKKHGALLACYVAMRYQPFCYFHHI